MLHPFSRMVWDLWMFRGAWIVLLSHLLLRYSLTSLPAGRSALYPPLPHFDRCNLLASDDFPLNLFRTFHSMVLLLYMLKVPTSIAVRCWLWEPWWPCFLFWCATVLSSLITIILESLPSWAMRSKESGETAAGMISYSHMAWQWQLGETWLPCTGMPSSWLKQVQGLGTNDQYQYWGWTYKKKGRCLVWEKFLTENNINKHQITSSQLLHPPHPPSWAGTLTTDITIHILSEDCHYSKMAFPGLSRFKPKSSPPLS